VLYQARVLLSAVSSQCRLANTKGPRVASGCIARVCFLDHHSGHPCTNQPSMRPMRPWMLVHSYLTSWPASTRGCMGYQREKGCRGEGLVVFGSSHALDTKPVAQPRSRLASAFPALFCSVIPVPQTVSTFLLCTRLSFITLSSAFV
jgi:hypothetical protein